MDLHLLGMLYFRLVSHHIEVTSAILGGSPSVTHFCSSQHLFINFPYIVSHLRHFLVSL